jgi:hypothetical protein
MEVELSPFAVSCTRFVRAIKIKVDYLGGAEIFILDTPGIEDTRGAEIDAANQYGNVQAGKVCASVLPVFVLSREDEGGRMSGLKKIVHFLAGMFKSLKEQSGAFYFLFNKYPD